MCSGTISGCVLMVLWDAYRDTYHVARLLLIHTLTTNDVKVITNV